MYTTNILIKRKGDNYLVIIHGKLFINQPIIQAPYIPHHLAPAAYWYMYIVHLLYRFGFTQPNTTSIIVAQ